jgi:hypothetical protein
MQLTLEATQATTRETAVHRRRDDVVFTSEETSRIGSYSKAL